MIRASAVWLRRLAALAMALVVLAAVAAGLLAWRLSQGPLSLPALARMIEERAAQAGLGARLSVGEVALVWEGFSEAVDRPLDLRVADVRALDAAGATVAAIPEGSVSLSLRALLLGRLEPRAIELRGASLTFVRAEDGSVAIDLGAPADAGDKARADPDAGLAESLLGRLGLGAGPQPGQGWIADLQRVRIRGAAFTVIDRQLGATWRVPDATLDLRRSGAGGISVALAGAAIAGAARVGLSASGRLGADGAGAIAITLDPVAPADLAAALPGLAPLAALDAPLSGTVTVRFGDRLTLAGGEIAARLGAGEARLPGGGVVPIASGLATLSVAADAVTLSEARVTLPGTHGPSPTLSVRGMARRDGAAWTATAEVNLDRVAFADLPLLWPEGLGTGERAWITGNITAGTVTGGRVRLAATLDPASGTVEPTALAGEIAAEGASVHYLRPMPPVAGVAATATIALDKVVVVTRGGALGAIRTTDATIVLSGLDAPTQWADIAVRIESPLPAALDLLAHPKLGLFARRGPPPKGITGEGELDLALRFPLLDALTVDGIEARARAEASRAAMPEVVLGRSITEGHFTLEADQDGMKIEGTGRLAGLEAALGYGTDFRAGPASQVTERATLRLAPQPGVAEAFGIDPAPYLTGALGGEAQLAVRRDGQSTLTVRADLTRARLAVRDLGWEKPQGATASAEGTLRLAGPRLVAAELTRLEGPGLAGRARASFGTGGRVERIEVTELRLGETRLAGEVRAPARAGEPWRITARGALLDLTNRPDGAGEAAAGAGEPTPPIALEARFERVRLGERRESRDVTVALGHDGRRMQALEARGGLGDHGSYTASLRAEAGGRALDLRSDDAGALLALLGVMDSMAGGRLHVAGRYDDTRPTSPLAGEATIEEFRLRDAPAIGRVLQAMTLYGLLEMARGPGLSFSNLVAPFTLDGDTLQLHDARAYGPSLGFTAKGSADLAGKTLAIEGTIVPAYLFNSLLGHIPLIGRIFAPERGGGVFAATYRVRGPFADPEVSVNPLAALTPGFLRGLFGFLDPGEAGSTPAPTPEPSPHDRSGG